MSELRTNKIYPRDGLPAGSNGGIIQLKLDSSGTGTGGGGGAGYVSLTSTTFVDIGLEITITPTNASNKMYMSFNLNANNADSGTSADRLKVRIVRNGSSIWSIDEGLADYGSSNIHVQGISGAYLDSPATTSAITYKVQAASSSSSNCAINNNGISDFTVMEVSG